MKDPLNMDINRNTINKYWESYEESLKGEQDQWRVIQEENYNHPSFYKWTNITEIILEVTFCLLLAILIMILYFCINRKSKHHLEDSENSLSDPPAYDDVIKKDRDELANLKDLPSYLDALRIEDEMRCTS